MTSISIGTLAGDGRYLYKVVGTSHYQDVLEEIVGGKTEECSHFQCHAILLAEPTNAYDRNAVAVSVNGKLVGYISSQDDVEMVHALHAAGLGAGQCEAKIVGGWLREDGDEGSFGVRLNAMLPFRFGGGRTVNLVDHAASLPSHTVRHHATIDFGPATELHRQLPSRSQMAYWGSLLSACACFLLAAYCVNYAFTVSGPFGSLGAGSLIFTGRWLYRSAARRR